MQCAVLLVSVSAVGFVAPVKYSDVVDARVVPDFPFESEALSFSASSPDRGFRSERGVAQRVPRFVEGTYQWLVTSRKEP